MQINFTKDQYKNLLKLIYCGDMMINGVRLHEDKIEEIDSLCSHIYSKAKEFGCEDMIEYWEEEKVYIGSPKLEDDEEVNEYMQAYDDDKEEFWEKLIYMLAKRDYSEKYKNPILNNSVEEIDKLAFKYDDEFTKNGIINLKIAKKKN